MKTLSVYQMEITYAGSLKRVLSCISQVTGGMSAIAGIAAALAFTTTPIGWGILLVGGISLAAGIASDPTACD
jgi:short subunit fatty acids transporter